MSWNASAKGTSFRPCLEELEERLTPTTLPSGFTQALVVSGLGRTTAMDFSPDGRLFVLQQGGAVKLVRDDGTTWPAIHVNVDSPGERGLLGIAFDPAYSSNHYVYLYYTNPKPGAALWATGEHNQLSRFTVDDSNPQQPMFTNEAPILDWNNLSAATSHNGGAIHFGLDGMLYADAGDNLQTFTVNGNTYRVSQSLGNLLGKQLRIDVSQFNSGVATRDDTTVGHLIPADNPFVGKAKGINQLIYALGLRNPFTFAVQPGTGTIFINDVGQNTWEEIDKSVPGGNYGWSGGNTDGFGQHPPGPGTYQDPLLAYNHNGGGAAVVGGAFYNPATVQFPSSYVGKYFFADLIHGWIRVFDPATPGTRAHPNPFIPFASGIKGYLHDLKVDAVGNLYYLTSTSIFKISSQAPQITFPPRGQTVTEGQTATFSVTAAGPSLSYQWQHLVGGSWTNVGSNAPTLTLANVTLDDAGSYRVVVSNLFSTVTSSTFLVRVAAVFPSSFRLEAESLALTNYTVESNAPASGSQDLMLPSGSSPQTGTATGNLTFFNGASGLYAVTAGYLTETTGSSTLSLTLGGQQVASWAVEAGDGSPAQRRLPVVKLTNGEAIVLGGMADQGGAARWDYVDFAPLQQVVALNAGGGKIDPYLADTNFTGGSAVAVQHAIDLSGVTDPAPAAVYQSWRYGNPTYTIPNLTPNALYVVRLHFAEGFVTARGLRVFNVAINAQPVLSNYDVFAAAGGAFKAVAEEFDVLADPSGTIKIQFATVIGTSRINGIEVLTP